MYILKVRGLKCESAGEYFILRKWKNLFQKAKKTWYRKAPGVTVKQKVFTSKSTSLT